METVDRPHARALVALAERHPDVLVLSADLTSSCEANDLRDAMPDRFISCGMTEQHMISFAAGLAREGFTPYLHTFAVFLTRRVFDQVAMSVAYPKLRVRLVGFLPGLTTPGGVTHQAIDDVGLMRLLPNMTILDCGDATEVEGVLAAAQAVDGPVYIRMLRGRVPRLFPTAQPFTIGRCRELGGDGDLLLLTSGICTEEALRACALLRRRGVGLRHLHISTLKPFADPVVIAAIAAARDGVITMENHLVTGGLGTCVAELMAEHACSAPLIRMGLCDVYAHGASRDHLLREYGLDALGLVRRIEKMRGVSLGIDERDLAAVRLEAVHHDAKPEAL